MKKRIAIGLAACCLAAVVGWRLFAADTGAAAEWLDTPQPVDNAAFSRRMVQDDPAAGVSMYAWDMFFINSGAFYELSHLLSALDVTRVYQCIPQAYLTLPDTAVMVGNLAAMGVETVYLTGERDWLFDGLDAFYDEIDALDAYNKGVGALAPIGAVALDVESYTTDEWKADPADCFAQYVDLMAQAYAYAHARGLSVVQVIPAILDEIDRATFERFIETCCDEVSVMNYTRQTTLSAIWNEVLTCRARGVPIESIAETMPENDYFSVTPENTFFYEGFDALQQAQQQLDTVYGVSLGHAYHYYRTLLRMYTGGGLAEIYPYTTTSDPLGDENRQPVGLDRILLAGDDGTYRMAYSYSPYYGEEPSERCFLAVGVRADVRYTVVLDHPYYEVAGDAELTFALDDGSALDAVSLRVRPKT